MAIGKQRFNPERESAGLTNVRATTKKSFNRNSNLLRISMAACS